MSDELWYYELLMEEFGPISAANIQQLIDDHTLGRSDRIRRESSDDWIAVTEFPGAATAAPGNFDDDRHSDLDIDAFTVERADRHSDLDIDSFDLHGDSDSPQPVVAHRHEPDANQIEDEDEFEPEFFVQSVGHVLGPLSQHELIDMAVVGSLSQGDEIRQGADGQWIAVETIPGVSEAILMQQISVSPSEDDATAPNKELAPASRKKIAAKNTKASGKKTRHGRPKGKRRKRSRKDELLQEIFAEVFTEDGKVRDREAESPSGQPAALPSETGAAMTGDAMAASAGIGSPGQNPDAGSMPPVAANPGSFGEGSAMPGVSPHASTPMAASASPPPFAKPKAPYKPPKKVKSSSGGGGFQMPEPKVLGIVGGGLAVVLILVLGFTGIAPIPGFGINPESLFEDFATDYKQATTAEDWKALKSNYATPARSVAVSLAPSVSTDPEAKRFQKAALLIVKMLARPFDDKETRAKLYVDFAKLRGPE